MIQMAPIKLLKANNECTTNSLELSCFSPQRLVNSIHYIRAILKYVCYYTKGKNIHINIINKHYLH